ncbi:amino acid adenylation domain-containing protein [Roseateles sp. SL47]|uniref:non-ribosomal peptide synthetase n=1 Tax=Roseateles sp. SL47 TaxID=2995138 RepID=UPI0022720D1A|nr:non-ribosomal peptide synthetase [Roseateles sp. SL47]WAC73072.1 amino acid adenylation domain-containing protein [Roseateles sp. SL47]
MTLPLDSLPNFYAVLRHWAALRPQQVAFHFMPDGEGIQEVLTFGELDRRARAIAARLQAREWSQAPLLLQYRPGLNFIVAFFACLYAGAIAVPAYPPTNNRSKSSRLRALVQSCGARAVLTDGDTLPDLNTADLTLGLPLLRTDTEDATEGATEGTTEGATWTDPGAGSEDIAFLQYSSGSTGDPKGVIITHGNLLHNQRSIREAMGNGDHTIFASWLPLFHDMGLVGNVMQPLYLGIPCYLMPPMAFMQQPRRWLEVISRYRVTCTGGPNFAFDLCVDRIPEHERAGLDLSSWAVAYNGSEPVRPETLRRFSEAYRPHGLDGGALYPCYGLAEGSLLVSGPEAGRGPSLLTVDSAALEEGRIEPSGTPSPASVRQLTSCGKIWGGQTVKVIDPVRRTVCPPGQVGEIWLQGPSITRGYWKRPDADAALIVPREDQPGEGAYCRTGDLGAFVNDELYITGRLKEVLIVRGRNHYPQDIEQSVQAAWPGFVRGGGAAFLDEDRLVLVQEIGRTYLRQFDADAATRIAREVLAEQHGLTLAALVPIKPATLAKTSSGKIRRQAMRESYRDGSLIRVDAPSPSAAAAAAAAAEPMVDADQPLPTPFPQLCDVLATMGVHAEGLAPETTLWQLGLDSLQIVDLHIRLGHLPGQTPSLDTLFSGITLMDLAASLGDRPAAPPLRPLAPASAPATHDGELPLVTPYQAAIWLRQQQQPAEPFYNLSVALEFDAPMAPDDIDRAVAHLVSQHRHLRQRLVVGGDGILTWQDCAAPVPRRVSAEGWSEPRLDALLREIRATPFALEAEAPVRACVIGQGRSTWLVLCIHHIATDFTGASHLVAELLHTLAAPARRVPGQDLGRTAAGLLNRLAAPGEDLPADWLASLAAAPADIDLGLGAPRSADAGPGALAQCYAHLDAGLFRACRQLAPQAGGTLNVFLASAFAALLHRYSGQSSFCLGMPFSVRPPALADWPGSAVNMVPIAFEFAAQQSLTALVAQTTRAVVQGLRYRHVPLTIVADRVRRLQPDRTRIFDAVFICQSDSPANGGLPATLLAGCDDWHPLPERPELRVRSRRVPSTAGQALLTLLVFPDEEGGARLSLEYDRARIPQAFAQRILGHYEGLLRAAVRQPDQPLHAWDYLPATELDQQWLQWNATGWDSVPPEASTSSLVQMFLQQAHRRPTHTAVADAQGAQLSYAELHRFAQGIRHLLEQREVKPGDCVGIALPRNHRLPAAILGVLMCGAAYVPLDLDYPPERLRHILKTSGAGVVVTVAGHAGEFQSSGARCLLLDGLTADALAPVPSAGPAPAGGAGFPHAGDLAYVLFTSGSTGQPKGVQVTHGNVLALLDWARQCFTEAERDRVLASTSVCFDLSVFELFVPLCLGTTCVITPRVLDLIEQPSLGITMINTVPSAIEALLASGSVPATVSTALVAGEPFRQALVDRLYRDSGVRRVLDLYGPTEDTVYSTFAERRPAGRESIGRALPGTRVYLLDAAQQPVPIGLPGELYLAGKGMSMGYKGRDDLTDAAFALPAALTHLETRAYRTGDIVRLAEDGEILYIGRRDHQIKLRGYRIELQEIDACLAGSGLVREAVADVVSTPAGQLVLVAHVAWPDGVDAPSASQALNAQLARHLPHYMRPQHLLVLGALPRTLNGKIDRRALPRVLTEPLAQHQEAPLEPGLMVELAAVWAEVLGTAPTSRHANFIELGGNSLSAVQLRVALQRRWSLDVPLAVLLTLPVLNEQAMVLAELRGSATAEAARNAVLSDNDGAELEEIDL